MVVVAYKVKTLNFLFCCLVPRFMLLCSAFCTSIIVLFVVVIVYCSECFPMFCIVFCHGFFTSVISFFDLL